MSDTESRPRMTAVMASCDVEERALETANGGAFTHAWSNHPVQVPNPEQIKNNRTYLIKQHE